MVNCRFELIVLETITVDDVLHNWRKIFFFVYVLYISSSQLPGNCISLLCYFEISETRRVHFA